MQIFQEPFLLGPSARNSDLFLDENIDFIYDFIQFFFILQIDAYSSCAFSDCYFDCKNIHILYMKMVLLQYVYECVSAYPLSFWKFVYKMDKQIYQDRFLLVLQQISAKNMKFLRKNYSVKFMSMTITFFSILILKLLVFQSA